MKNSFTYQGREYISTGIKNTWDENIGRVWGEGQEHEDLKEINKSFSYNLFYSECKQQSCAVCDVYKTEIGGKYEYLIPTTRRLKFYNKPSFINRTKT